MSSSDQGDFAGLSANAAEYGSSRVAVLPLPFERTTSYGRGTARGPRAILDASHYLEWYDEELQSEPCTMGVTTLPHFTPEAEDLGTALREIEAVAQPHLEANKFLISLGGEHSLSLPLVRVAERARGELAVVQFDAHADLRPDYEGTPLSHACVMRRIVDYGLPTLSVGVRSLSRPEADFIRLRGLPVLWASQLDDPGVPFQELIAELPDQIYLTFDVDYFDPSLLPATGTPEPGGGDWYSTLSLLRTLFREKTVVAMDLVELAPIPGQPSSDFLVAKLAYKCIGYLEEALRRKSRLGDGA